MRRATALKVSACTLSWCISSHFGESHF